MGIVKKEEEREIQDVIGALALALKS